MPTFVRFRRLSRLRCLRLSQSASRSHGFKTTEVPWSQRNSACFTSCDFSREKKGAKNPGVSSCSVRSLGQERPVRSDALTALFGLRPLLLNHQEAC